MAEEIKAITSLCDNFTMHRMIINYPNMYSFIDNQCKVFYTTFRNLKLRRKKNGNDSMSRM